MAEPLALPAQTPARALKPGQVQIRGKISGRRTVAGQDGRVFIHLITLPAPDEYSSPQTVEVTGRASLGGKDDPVSVVCTVGGFRRSFKATDKETGEVATVFTADNKLRVVEE